jgi:DivIVA domain-containing protein
VVWFLGVLVVLVIGATVVVAAGRGGEMRPVYDDRPDLLVPDAPLTGDVLRSVRFSVAVRGYRMDEVDALLARLADQLDDPHAAYRRPLGAPGDRPGDGSAAGSDERPASRTDDGPDDGPDDQERP